MPLRTLVHLLLLAFCVFSCSKPTVAPVDAPAAPSIAPSASTGAGDPSFCDTMKIKCPQPRPTGPDDIAACKELASDPKCGAVNVAAMRCDQSVEACNAEHSFKPCHAEHAAAGACMGLDPNARGAPLGR